ncbi:MAG TPA: MCE family protein [Pseudonocardiaceae bacterium]|jgi:phospholipid/cholesterol/gamma-HCH transport system substrate-binding protein|nr:MCE family protein [Pseudonocardiaceae bacterium]
MKPIRERNPIWVGVAGLAIMLVIGLLVYFADDLPLIGGGTTYTAEFTEAAGLVSGNDVTVAGVRVGNVTGVSLDGDHVKVSFRVDNAWIGNTSTASIEIKTLLGEKYLALDPLGPSTQDPGQTIPVSRTISPYDVTSAFNDLSTTVGQIDTSQLANGFEAVASAFGTSAPDIRGALDGLSSLSETISSRDNQLAQLLSNSQKITQQVANDNTQFQSLLTDGNLLLAELQQRKDAINALLSSSVQLGQQISGLVQDNNATLAPTLAELDQVTNVLQQNQNNLNQALALIGPYYRLLGNTLGNGRWMDAYLCGLVSTNGSCMPPKVGG